MSNQTKECKQCGFVLDIDEFHKEKNGKPRSMCKPCHRAYCRGYYDDHREEIRKRSSERRNRKYDPEKQREYYLKNREKISAKRKAEHDPEKAREYYLKNRERILARAKERREKAKREA